MSLFLTLSVRLLPPCLGVGPVGSLGLALWGQEGTARWKPLPGAGLESGAWDVSCLGLAWGQRQTLTHPSLRFGGLFASAESRGRTVWEFSEPSPALQSGAHRDPKVCTLSLGWRVGGKAAPCSVIEVRLESCGT